MSKFLEKEFEVESKHLGAQKFKAQIWQAETLEELEERFGGRSELVSRLNVVLVRGAEASGKRHVATSEVTKQEDMVTVIEKAITAIQDYKPEATGGESKAAKVEKYDTAMALANSGAIDFSKVPGDVMLKFLQSGDKSVLEQYL